MARPRKWRRVCELPESNMFGPPDGDFRSAQIVMTVDEYETIRLIDVEGMTQEECAEQMNVARTTVQRMYFDARKKLGESLVLGKVLHIEGGDYRLCDGLSPECPQPRCFRGGRGPMNGRGFMNGRGPMNGLGPMNGRGRGGRNTDENSNSGQ